MKDKAGWFRHSESCNIAIESGKLGNVDKVFKYMMSYVYYVHVL